jgi:hypothetical protein
MLLKSAPPEYKKSGNKDELKINSYEIIQITERKEPNKENLLRLDHPAKKIP